MGRRGLFRLDAHAVGQGLGALAKPPHLGAKPGDLLGELKHSLILFQGVLFEPGKAFLEPQDAVRGQGPHGIWI